MLPYDRRLKGNSQVLRKEMTDAERVLWKRIRGKQILGVQFYRQKPVENYIVDFYAPVAGLVVEVDGGQHFDDESIGRDSIRDTCLKKQGLIILRIDNRQVLLQTDAVIEAIFHACEKRLEKARLENPPNPPLPKEGLIGPPPSRRGTEGDFLLLLLLFI